MRFEYLLYPEAVKLINPSGIASRVEKLKASSKLPYLEGPTYTEEVVETVRELKKEGFYKKIPENFSERYKQIMNGILRKPENFSWEVQKLGGKVKEPCTLEDLFLFSGEFASLVLTPDEIWDYSKFGFSSPSEFITTIGAFVFEESKPESSYKEGYIWESNRSNGVKLINKIAGSDHCDLRVYQTDVTPYATIDPFGSLINLRPKMESDCSHISACHSTESAMFVAVMKYTEQQGIDAEYRKDNGRALIEWGASLGRSGGSCAEHFSNSKSHPFSSFLHYDFLIPTLDENNETNQRSNFELPTEFGGNYEAFISSKGNLIFSYNFGRENSNKKPTSIEFSPEDSEHLLKGLIYQSAKGLGRTSPAELLDLLRYRYSSDFKTSLN